MRTRFVFFLLGAALLLASCSPKLTATKIKAKAPLEPEEEVVVLPPEAPDPENATTLEVIKIGDSGFTSSKNGTYDAVIAMAKTQARQAGGNVVRITRHLKPDFNCTTHRIEAVIMWVDDISSLVTTGTAAVNLEHPDYAVIYFFRDSVAGALVNYDVHIGDQPVYRSRAHSKAEVKIHQPGQIEIWAKTEAKVSLPLTIEMGADYYVRCDVNVGVLVGRPLMELVPAVTGKAYYESIQVK